MEKTVKRHQITLKSNEYWYKNCNFAGTRHTFICVNIALDITSTNNNTPPMPLYNAHLGGLLF